MNLNLSGKTILVTGASSGIGRQCAIACSEVGATVIMTGRNKERLNETLTAMQDPGRHISFPLDLLNYDQIEPMVAEATGRSGKIHGAVHCAGISTTLPLRVTSTKKMEEFFRTNAIAAVYLTRILTKKAYIAENGASIIFIASVMATVGEVGKTLYAMTKGALLAASKSLALELAPQKIRVNCVSPGVVITPMSQSSFYSQNEDSLNQVKSRHPLGLGLPEDVAGACVFLLSDAARWITGVDLPVDGGYMAR
jgi:NAD(P)-dependent dehydrogenase (short-subunit alcohol dehydrogenase family)